MIKRITHNAEGFKVMTAFEGWKVGVLRYNLRFSRLKEMERHLLTDEVFILTAGEATLYTEGETAKMERGDVYVVPAGVWHHIVVSEDASVVVVENSNTSIENTEKKYFDEKENP